MTAQRSLIGQFLDGTALPEQWLGAAFLAVILIAGVIGLVRQHVHDTRDESRWRR